MLSNPRRKRYILATILFAISHSLAWPDAIFGAVFMCALYSLGEASYREILSKQQI